MNLKIDISGSTPVKRPHMAFDKNLLAILMGRTAAESAATTSGDRRAWIDASLGEGEIETDDLDYYYLTLTMPEIYTGLEKCLRKCAGILEVCAMKAAATLNGL